MHGPHAAIVRAPRLRADRAAVRRRASAAVRALSRRVRKPRFRASARACTRPHGNRTQPEIRTCRPSASCRQPAPPGRGVRRSQPPPAGVCGTGGFRRLPSADESGLMRTALPCDAAQCSVFANGGSAPSAAPAVGTRSGHGLCGRTARCAVRGKFRKTFPEFRKSGRRLRTYLCSVKKDFA